MRSYSMNVPLGKVLTAGMKFVHEYDFGSTTELVLRVVSEGGFTGMLRSDEGMNGKKPGAKRVFFSWPETSPR